MEDFTWSDSYRKPKRLTWEDLGGMLWIIEEHLRTLPGVGLPAKEYAKRWVASTVYYTLNYPVDKTPYAQIVPNRRRYTSCPPRKVYAMLAALVKLGFIRKVSKRAPRLGKPDVYELVP